ncbi:MAG: class I SAM-dependent methyltransferase [Myxococcota bacterium]
MAPENLTRQGLMSVVESWVQNPDIPFAIRFGDGRSITGTDRPRFVLEFSSPDVIEGLMSRGDLAAFADAYIQGELKIHGDIQAAVGIAKRLRQILPVLQGTPRPGTRSENRSEPRIPQDDARDVQFHYDLPTEFFRLFLDQEMVYSCAYFERPGDSLEAAQRQKLDLTCRKLGLEPGDELLDVGCGWGSLLLHAVERYGVRAHGITLSPRQVETVQTRTRQRKLQDEISVAACHYIDLPPNRFDKVASIGMVEHVGRGQLRTYFDTLNRSLRPGGLLLNHGISVPRKRPRHLGGDFITRHVFPGSELIPVGDMLNFIEDAGLEIIDVQALRPHYSLTLGHWAHRYFSRRHEAARWVSERTLRIWDIYLPACQEVFAAGYVGVHQILAFKPDPSGIRQPSLPRAGVKEPFSERLDALPDREVPLALSRPA